MNDTELEKMTRFFLKKIFQGIPYVPTFFGSEDRLDNKLGMTAFSKNDDYEEEDYTSKEIAPGVFDYGSYEPSYLDADNHPYIEIIISESLKDDMNKLTGVLLHELCHYYCWYCGYEHRDGSSQFEGKLKEYGLPSCSCYRYDKTLKKHVTTFDFTTMENIPRCTGNLQKTPPVLK